MFDFEPEKKNPNELQYIYTCILIFIDFIKCYDQWNMLFVYGFILHFCKI